VVLFLEKRRISRNNFKYNLKNILKEDLLKLYRNHYPSINLTSENENLLKQLKANGYKLGLITEDQFSKEIKLKHLILKVF
jgi:phosphoglycolate phosphatase-like HAD superfamily hydrolase